MKRKEDGINFNDYNLRPPGSYLSDLSGFEEFQKSADEAEKAADRMIREMDAKAAGAVPVKETKTEEKPPERPDPEALLKELDGLVGLEKVKSNVRSLINLVKIRKLREENGLPVPSMSLHLVFMGNPGTGKTTVARLIAKLYFAIGVLSKGQLVEVDRSGLVAGYVGQTAIKTGEAIKKALGGVLFIDEAYALASGGDSGQDFGKEAIEIILKAMEDSRNDLVVIVAGYEGLMEKFIASNPGLESRFNRYLIFEDYNAEQLYEIFSRMCEKNQYTLTENAAAAVKAHLTEMYDCRDENFGNARDVRNFFENLMTVHADRVASIQSPTKENLMEFEKEDAEKAELM